MLSLRPYQNEVIQRLRDARAAGKRNILLVAPTGAGKTVIASAIVGHAVEKGSRVLFLAHRRELVAQASAKLDACAIEHGIIQAGFPTTPLAPVQVASIQTLHARAVRTTTMELPPAEVIVVDEAHHARARTYREIVEAYPDAVVLGLTATPCRSDGRGLGNVFAALVECPPVQALIDMGFLVPTRVYAPVEPDLTGVRVDHGDYVEKALAERMDQQQLVGDIVLHWHRLAERRKTVVFATGVNHSIHIRDEFRRSGVWAEHIDGATPTEERDAILASLSGGKAEVVVNCMVLTEGWDQPDVSCIVLARPTKSVGLYRQMIGRVLRPAEGKTDALVLDHAGAVFEHGFVEEPVQWTLRSDRRAETPVQARRLANAAPGLGTCPECSAVRRAGTPCSACGWHPVAGAEAVDVVDGELGRVSRDQRRAVAEAMFADKTEFFRQLLWIAAERGYRPGWAAYKFREKHGHWPEVRSRDPMPANDVVLSWVRSRQIAYARARQS